MIIFDKREADKMISDDRNMIREVDRTENGIKLEIINSPGRKPGVPSIDDEKRIDIILEDKLGTDQDIIAEQYGISQPTVSNLTNGKHGVNPSIAKQINDRLTPIRSKVLNRLETSLDSITDGKVEGLKAHQIGILAKQMSSILRDVTPSLEEEDKRPPQVIVYSPTMKTENFYEVKDV